MPPEGLGGDIIPELKWNLAGAGSGSSGLGCQPGIGQGVLQMAPPT